MRNEYKLYGDEALKVVEGLPKGLVDNAKTIIETEILMEKVKTNENIEYKNCSHFESVQIELTNALKQGNDKCNEYWQNQEADLTKKEIKQINEYIQKLIDAEKK